VKKNSVYFLLIAALVGLDQLTKILVARSVDLYGSVTVIPGFFNITRIHNKGAIFGAFSAVGGSGILFLLTSASLIALALVVYYFIKTPAADRRVKTALALILAGALGNLVDRVVRGFVVDFLDFYVGRWHWPFFNVADSCITVGALLLLLFFVIRKPACSPSSSA
jgi:signal peptidase II